MQAYRVVIANGATGTANGILLSLSFVCSIAVLIPIHILFLWIVLSFSSNVGQLVKYGANDSSFINVRIMDRMRTFSPKILIVVLQIDMKKPVMFVCRIKKRTWENMEFGKKGGRFEPYRDSIVTWLGKKASLTEIITLISASDPEKGENYYKYDSLKSFVTRDKELDAIFQESKVQRRTGKKRPAKQMETDSELINEKLIEMSLASPFVAIQLKQYGTPDNPPDQPYNNPLDVTMQSFKFIAKSLVIADRYDVTAQELIIAQKIYITQIEFLITIHGSNAVEGFTDVNFIFKNKHIPDETLTEYEKLMEKANTPKDSVEEIQESLFK